MPFRNSVQFLKLHIAKGKGIKSFINDPYPSSILNYIKNNVSVFLIKVQ